MAIYREIVERRKALVILKLLIVLVVILFLSNFLSKFMIGSVSLAKICRIFLTVLMIGIIIIELKRSFVKYRYCVVGDELIISKLDGKSENIVENIRFKDIKLIGKCEKEKKDPEVLGKKNYVVSLINNTKYYCVYSNQNELKKFYFQPSEKLVNKIKCKKNCI